MSILDDLRSNLPLPSKQVEQKVSANMTAEIQTFIQKSPFMVMATSNASGDCDSSPKGGKPGFVKVLDDNHLLIPELIGNRLFQGLINIQSNAKVGLLFMIPGIDKTVRVNGCVKEISPEALEKIVSQPEVLNPDKKVNFAFGLLVTINESYLHCPRSLKFADIWNEKIIYENKGHTKP